MLALPRFTPHTPQLWHYGRFDDKSVLTQNLITADVKMVNWSQDIDELVSDDRKISVR